MNVTTEITKDTSQENTKIFYDILNDAEITDNDIKSLVKLIKIKRDELFTILKKFA